MNKEEMFENLYYAIYKGDNFLFMGTKKECSDYLNVKENTISFYNTPTYQKKNKSGNRIIVIKVDD